MSDAVYACISLPILTPARDPTPERLLSSGLKDRPVPFLGKM